MFLLASCHVFGYGTEKNFDKAFLFADKCIRAGCYKAFNLLGYIFETGELVEKDIDRALGYYYNLAKRDDVFVLYRTGKIYAEGATGEKEFRKAIACFEKAAELGDENAMRFLVGEFGSEDSEYYNFDRAAYWQRQLAYRGSEKDICSLLEMYKGQWNVDTEIKLYSLLLYNGSAETLHVISRMSAEGRYFKQDFRVAGAIIKMAVEKAPDNLDYRNTQGEIYLMKGDMKRARKIWKSIMKINPDFYKSSDKASKLNEYMTAKS